MGILADKLYEAKLVSKDDLDRVRREERNKDRIEAEKSRIFEVRAEKNRLSEARVARATEVMNWIAIGTTLFPPVDNK